MFRVGLAEGGPAIISDALIDALRQMPPPMQEDAVAANVLSYYFGHEWIVKHVVPNWSDTGFLRLRRDLKNSDAIRHRLSILAENLDNLIKLNVPGFPEFTQKLRNDPNEGHFAETNLAALLYRSGVKFRFHCQANQAQKTKAPDFIITMPSGTEVPAEAKCRIGGGDFSRKKLRAKLASSLAQLPKGKPGFVLAQVPAKWQIDSLAEVESAIDAFYRVTSRVASVKIFSLFTIELPFGTFSKGIRRESNNPHHPFGKLENWNILSQNPLPPDKWWSIRRMINWYLNDQQRILRERAERAALQNPSGNNDKNTT